MKYIRTVEELKEIWSLEKAIIYLQVSWALSERKSRNRLQNILNDSKVELLFGIDLDEFNDENDVLISWFKSGGFRQHGNGELLMIQKGRIIEVVKNPLELDRVNLTGKLLTWAK